MNELVRALRYVLCGGSEDPSGKTLWCSKCGPTGGASIVPSSSSSWSPSAGRDRRRGK